MVGVGVGAVAFIYGVPWIVGLLGFTGAGIAGGSVGAWMMSLYGGAVTSGSIVAVLQSIGAAGMSPVATAIAGAIGGIAGEATARVFRQAKDQDVVEGVAACLMSPCVGNFDADRAVSVLKVFGSDGIDAIRDWHGRDSLEKCLQITVRLQNGKSTPTEHP